MNSKKYYSWVLYDWANSAYATIVLAGFFPIIYAEYYATTINDSERTLYLGFSNSVASIVLIFIAPIFGLLSDRFSNKKIFLFIFAALSISSTFILSIISNDSCYILASILFSISLLGFMMSNVFYDSMLLNFESDNYDAVSSMGYAFGYLGGGLAFVFSLVLLYMQGESSVDLISSKKIVFIIAGLWWTIFMIPLLVFWKDNKNTTVSTTVFDTFREIRLNKSIFYFLIAYWVYIDGVDTIIRMAVNYGLTIGFNSFDLLIALLVTQFVAFPGTLLINKFAEYFSSETAIISCLLVYLIITVQAYFLDSIIGFYLIASLVGLVQGGIQALSRSYFARLIPNEKHSEYFGIYNMLGKFAALLGPIIVGLVTFITDNSRIGILSISIFFIFGIILFSHSRKHKLN